MKKTNFIAVATICVALATNSQAETTIITSTPQTVVVNPQTQVQTVVVSEPVVTKTIVVKQPAPTASVVINQNSSNDDIYYYRQPAPARYIIDPALIIPAAVITGAVVGYHNRPRRFHHRP